MRCVLSRVEYLESKRQMNFYFSSIQFEILNDVNAAEVKE